AALVASCVAPVPRARSRAPARHDTRAPSRRDSGRVARGRRRPPPRARVKLHTRRRGSGPLLVCHPGGPGFDGTELHDLGGLDATRTLLLVDPRGTGGSPDAETYRLDDYVADLDELHDTLDGDQVDLLGFSHGGLVAIAYAVAHPTRVRRLVLTVALAAFTP